MDKDWKNKKFYEYSDESEVEKLFEKLKDVDEEFP